MRVILVTPPTAEPVDLPSFKLQIRQDSSSFDDGLGLTQSLSFASHVITTDYYHYGAGIDVIGKLAEVIVSHGANGATGTVDTIIQESDTNTETITLDVAPAADWEADDIITGQSSGKTCVVVAKLTALTYTVKDRTGIFTLGEVVGVTGTANKLADQGVAKPTFSGSGYTEWKISGVAQPFTQVTTLNDNADYKKQYTGTKQYIRTASKVLLAACEFGTSILTNAATTAEDALLTSIIQSAREVVEDETRRALMTSTFDLYLDRFPTKNYITIPFGNLQSVTHIKYTDSTGTETTMAVTTDYTVETNGEKCGRVVLPYNGTWPTATLKPSNPIVVRFVCGWAAANLIPAKIKQAILMIAHDLWSNRSAQDLIMTNSQAYVINTTVQKLLWNAKLWEEL